MDKAAPPPDVAISFLWADRTTAIRLFDALKSHLSVFYFEDRQNDLAGRDGTEAMRAPFLNARVSVVLFRKPWGEAGWTGVERAAICDACLKRGFQNLFLVAMDTTSPIPSWVPNTHVRFNMEQFDFSELIGAIKAKVLELGGSVRTPTTLDLAEQHRNEARYQKARRQFQLGSNGFDRSVASVQEMTEALSAAGHRQQLVCRRHLQQKSRLGLEY